MSTSPLEQPAREYLTTPRELSVKSLGHCAQVFDDLEDVRYSFAEYRISIYGRSRDEFAKLGAWSVGIDC